MHVRPRVTEIMKISKTSRCLVPAHLQAFNYRKNPMNLFITTPQQRTTPSKKVL